MMMMMMSYINARGG